VHVRFGAIYSNIFFVIIIVYCNKKADLFCSCEKQLLYMSLLLTPEMAEHSKTTKDKKQNNKIGLCKDSFIVDLFLFHSSRA